MGTVKVKNVSPLGDVENYLARRKFLAGEVVEVDASVAGTVPSTRPFVEGEDVPTGHLIVDEDGSKRVVVPGTGLLGQPENFVLVEDAPALAPARKATAPQAVPPA